jgi:hypothetical protein
VDMIEEMLKSPGIEYFTMSFREAEKMISVVGDGVGVGSCVSYDKY